MTTKDQPIFTDTTYWWQPITADQQKQLFLEMGSSWFINEMRAACSKIVPDNCSADLLAEKLHRRWRKAGLVKYGDGKWWKIET